MRPVLVSIGPLSPLASLAIGALLVLLVVLWRRLARSLGEKVGPLTTLNLLLHLVGLAAATALVWWVINRMAPVEIKAYGTMLVIAFAAGLWWLTRTAPREELSLADGLDLALYILIGSIIGARLVFSVFNWSDYTQAPLSVFQIWQGGLSFHGGVIGAIAAVLIYCRRRHARFWRLADLLTPSVPLGYAITRIGCFLNGCCYGCPTSSPWGVVFPNANTGGVPTPRVPTQLWAVAANLVIFALVAWYARRKHPTGRVFLVYIVLYSIYRFVIEFWRRGETAKIFAPLAPLTEAQVASLALVLVALIVIVVQGVRARRALENPDRAVGAALTLAESLCYTAPRLSNAAGAHT